MTGMQERAVEEAKTLSAVAAEFDDAVLRGLMTACSSGQEGILDIALVKFLVGSEVRA